MSQITLRLPDSLHKKAKEMATKDHVSLNTMITVALAEKLSVLENTNVLEERSKLGANISFEDAFGMVPDNEPDEIDKL